MSKLAFTLWIQFKNKRPTNKPLFFSMKIKLYLLLLLALSQSLFAQLKKTDLKPYKYEKITIKGQPIICPADYTDANTYRGMAKEVEMAINKVKQANLRLEGEKKATFEVDYIGFPDNAKESFERATAIWSEVISSKVPIRVVAIWDRLGPRVLGSAFPADFRRNGPGAPKAFTWYPIALAEKFAGADLNSTLEYDIVCRFSADVNWYFGATGTPAVGQFDLTTVILHELCHGLGFVSSFEVEGSRGSFGFGTPFPFAFDKFVFNEKNESLLDTSLFTNPSTLLRNELVSENLFFNGSLTNAANNNRPARLYAPTIYDAGSSISHLDDDEYPAGSANSLMTPSSGLREINLDPGPVTRAIFNDMGWQGTNIIHDPLSDFEQVSNIEFKVRINSDTTFDKSLAQLHVLELNLETATQADVILTNAVVYPLEEIGDNEFSYNYDMKFPASAVFYWFSVSDDFGKSLTSPPDAPDLYWLFFTGIEDEAGPYIEHDPYDFVNTSGDLAIQVNSFDDYQTGVESVKVRYSFNNGPFEEKVLPKFVLSPETSTFSQGSFDENSYLDTAAIPRLNAGDRVRYQIIARDANGNETVLPTTAGGPSQDDGVVPAYYQIAGVEIGEVVTKYVTDFEIDDQNFATIGFNIGTPEGLNNGALFTPNPYPNGLGLYDPTSLARGEPSTFVPFENNSQALFSRPIEISEDSATISFDEIVFVEPGEDGSLFGEDGFYDYVVVEALAGGRWVPLIDGYDATQQSEWATLFTGSFSPANAFNPTSTAIPNSALFRPREINLLDALGEDAVGARTLIRFRLFSDQLLNGYGWVIDNLAIQAPKPRPLSLNTEELISIKVGPNPSSNFVDVSADNLKIGPVEVSLTDVSGRRQLAQNLEVNTASLRYRLEVSQLPAGVYFLKIDDGSVKPRTAKIIKN